MDSVRLAWRGPGVLFSIIMVATSCGARSDPLDPNAPADDGSTFDCAACPAATYSGEFVVESQADADSLAQYSVVSGALHLTAGARLDNLDGFNCLASTGKGLIIEAATLDDLVGFTCLRAVGMRLLVTGDGLATLDVLESLRSVGTRLMITDMPRLQDIEGLRGLETVDGDVIIKNVANLPTCDAEALVDQLVHLGGEVTIKGTLSDACGP